MKADEGKFGELKDAAKLMEKSFWEDNTQVFAALMMKVARGERSEYLKRLTSRELKKIKAIDLINSFKQLYDCRCDVNYTGNLPAQEVASFIKRSLPKLTGSQENAISDMLLETPQQRTVYLFDMPESRQTIVALYRPLSAVASDRDRVCLKLWGEYFGGGMSSVLFQEVREFRSMAYASQGVALTPNLANSSNPSGYVALVATQGDKAMQAVELLDSLVNDMPMNVENFAVAQQSLLNEINNTYPTFRGKPLIVSTNIRNGFSQDPGLMESRLISALTQADVEAFYQRHIKGQPYQLMVVGNLKKVDLDSLAKYGQLVKVKKDEIYKTKESKKK